MDFNDKKEWLFVICPSCNKPDYLIPRKTTRERKSGFNFVCKECDKQFALNYKNHNFFLHICNKNPKKYKNSIIFDFLYEIWRSPNHSEILKSKYSRYQFEKYRDFLYYNEYVIYEPFSIDLSIEVFKINFFQHGYGCTVLFRFFLPTTKNGKLRDKLNSLKKRDFKRLNLNFEFLYSKIRKGFLIEFYKKLPKYSHQREIVIRKKIEYYCVKQLKHKKIFCRKLFDEGDAIPIMNFRTEEYKMCKLEYEISEVLGSDFSDEVNFGNCYKLVFKLEKDGFKIRLHEVRASNIVIDDVLMDRVNNAISANGSKIGGNYFTLSVQNGQYLQFIICNNVRDKQKNGKCNWDLLGSGINEFIEKLFGLNFDIDEIIEILGTIFSYKIIIETATRILTPERLVYRDFEYNKWYKVFKSIELDKLYRASYKIDKSNGYLELDLKFKTDWLTLINIIDLFSNLQKIKEISEAIE